MGGMGIFMDVQIILTVNILIHPEINDENHSMFHSYGMRMLVSLGEGRFMNFDGR